MVYNVHDLTTVAKDIRFLRTDGFFRLRDIFRRHRFSLSSMTRFAWEIGAFLLSLAQPPSSGIALSSLRWGGILFTCAWRKCLTSTQSRTTTRKRPSCYERKRVRQASDQQSGFESGLTLRLHWEMSTIFAGIFDLSKGCPGGMLESLSSLYFRKAL